MFQKSGRRAQESYAKALDSAIQTYGAGDRARRSAIASVSRTFQRLGDRWVPRSPQSARTAQATRRSASSANSSRPTQSGNIDMKSTKDNLMNAARRMQIPGRSRMNKPELVAALRKANRTRSSSR
jgi:hypothetical protein